MSPEPASPAEFAYQAHRFTPRVWATPTLVAINALVFLAMVVSGVSFLEPQTRDLVIWGGNFGALGPDYGQPWRLFTSMFVHVGIVHIAMNMVVLWDIGRFVERLLGNAGFIVVYVLAGLAGSLASALVHPDTVSVGASAAIFGLYGALFGYLVRYHHTVPRPLVLRLRKSGGVFVLANLAFGLVPGIDLSAHIGGLVGGFLFGAALSCPLTEDGARRRLLRNVGVAAFGAGAIGIAVWALRSP
jgi:rhomboid protease GluP